MEKPLLNISFDGEADSPYPGINHCFAMGFIALLKIPKDVNILCSSSVEPYIVSKLTIYPETFETPEKDTLNWWLQPERKELYHKLNKQYNINEEVMKFWNWYSELKKTYNIRFVAYPSNYDWQYLNNLVWRFVPNLKKSDWHYCCDDLNTLVNTDEERFEKVLKDIKEAWKGEEHDPYIDALHQGLLWNYVVNTYNP
jgi:hypothetical protein